MNEETNTETTSRGEPVGEPAVRGDPAIAGQSEQEAIAFDPDDPESVSEAESTVRSFAGDDEDTRDVLDILRVAAACATVVQFHESYTDAAAAVGSEVSISFLRKWARVHDLPIAIRRHIALEDIAPTAAMHVARVDGAARFLLAWAILDNDLTVDEVRRIASDVAAGTHIETALETRGVTPGELRLVLPTETYLSLRRTACLDGERPGELVAELFEEHGPDRNGSEDL
ncbi:MAG: hypothetical protein ABEJ58_07230 [Halodesulfurarchaeum sp.]